MGVHLTNFEGSITDAVRDSIAKVTDAIGIPKCGGCAKRQEWLNRLVPYAADG